MTINIQIDAEHLEKLVYIGQQTHRDPSTLLSQEIDRQYQQLQTQNATNGVLSIITRWEREAVC